VSSSYFEGRTCPLGKRGYSRDGKPGLAQIIYGLLCDTDGRPVAVEVFTGELHDDKTPPSQVVKLKDRFGLSRVVVVADRGMVTKANIELLKEADGVDWITALKAPTIKKLARSGVFQPSLLTSRTSGRSPTSPSSPANDWSCAATRWSGAQRARKRSELLAATEIDLAAIAHRVTAGTLIGADLIGLATGPALKRYRMRNTSRPRSLTPPSPTPQDRRDRAEARAGRVLHLRTGLTETDLQTGDVVRAYKNPNRPNERSIDQGPRSADPSDPIITSRTVSVRTY